MDVEEDCNSEKRVDDPEIFFRLPQGEKRIKQQKQYNHRVTIPFVALGGEKEKSKNGHGQRE